MPEALKGASLPYLVQEPVLAIIPDHYRFGRYIRVARDLEYVSRIVGVGKRLLRNHLPQLLDTLTMTQV